MEGYAEEKATNPFTTKDSCQTQRLGTESDPNRSLLRV